MPELIEAIKRVWVFEISSEYCENALQTFHDVSNQSSETKVTAANTEATSFLLQHYMRACVYFSTSVMPNKLYTALLIICLNATVVVVLQ